MFSKSEKEPLSDAEQREQYEYARTRINQKKGVLQHFTVFWVWVLLWGQVYRHL